MRWRILLPVGIVALALALIGRGSASSVSTPVETAFASLGNHLVIAYGYDPENRNPWQSYDPTAPPFANQLREVEPLEGYFVFVDQDITYTVGTQSRELHRGWNLVGWPGMVAGPSLPPMPPMPTVVSRMPTPTAVRLTPTPAPAAANWSGTWIPTSFGLMVLSQVGDSVTGTFEYRNGRIEGTVSGSVLEGRWSDEPTYAEPDHAGRFQLTMDADGDSFTGSWGYGGSAWQLGEVWRGSRG